MRQFFSIPVLVFLISFSGVVVGQRSLRPARINRTVDPESSVKRPSEPARTDAATSSSGKLVVGGAHAGLVGILQIETDLSLEGPLLIEVSSGGVAVPQRQGDTTGRLELPLTRKKQISVQINLVNGRNVIEVKDAVQRNEKIMLEWTGVATEQVENPVKAPVPEKPESPVVGSVTGEATAAGVAKNLTTEAKPNEAKANEAKANEAKASEVKQSEFKTSDKGNITAGIERVKDVANLKVHISKNLKGFKMKVVDAKDQEVESRSFTDLPRDIDDWSIRLKAAEGNKVTVSAMDESEAVVLSVPAAAIAAVKPPDDQPPRNKDEVVEYDWGRVRGYFSAGMIFSKERDDFSHSDMFLDFTLDKNYVARPFLIFKDFNTFFNARLTSIPVAEKETATPEGEPAPAEEDCTGVECEAFLNSKKAAMMQAGIYLPMYWDFTSWWRRVKTANSDRMEKNALFIAPLAKGGILTVTGDRETAEAQRFGKDDVFNFFSFGAMLGHFRLHTRQKEGSNDYENNPNIAPELISWLTLSMGRWENFEIEVPTGDKDAMGNDINVRQRPWRVEALGRLKIPETPFLVGFDGNFGKGPDDLRFIFGARFDVGKIMRTLKIAAAEDKVGRSGAAPTVATATPPATSTASSKP
jgi:hypothetical protein